MDKGERIMGPIPGGIISTSTGPVDPEEAQDIADFDTAVEELEEEAVEEELPEAEADDL
jgi:hypothetical protein